MDLREVLPLLARAAGGSRVHVVGGAVRDSILGRPPDEVDVVVEDGAGIEVAGRFAAIVEAPPPVVFERFGTAQVMWKGHPVEFVSARRESYSPHSRKPAVGAGSLLEDLERRDFTVNALLMEPDGEILDPLGRGLDDLRAAVLRTPLDPAATFGDDPLRMLRAARFSAELGFRLDPSLPPAMRAMRDRLAPPVLSVERAGDELRKMLVSERPAVALQTLDETGLLEILLPELHACHGVGQGGWHLYDVFGHTLAAVALAERDLTVRLAALLHDIGKPLTAAPDGSFVGHEEVGARLAGAILQRLRFSNAEIDRVSLLVRLHLRPVYYAPEWTDGAVRRLVRAAGPDLDALMALARADIGASAYPEPGKLDDLQRRIDSVRAEQPSRLRPAVTGDDLMRELRLAAGPGVGRVKEHLLALVLDGALSPDREAMLDFVRANAADLIRVAAGTSSRVRQDGPDLRPPSKGRDAI